MLFLKAQPYLADQPTEVLSALALYSEENFCAAGSIVRPAAGPIEKVRFLAEGTVEIHPLPGASGIPRSVSAPGVIGLPHHFSGVQETPEVRAVEDTLCLEVTASDLDQILEDHSSLMLNFARRGGEEAGLSLARLGAGRPQEPCFLDTQSANEEGASTSASQGTGMQTPIQLDIVDRLALARRAPFFSRTSLTVIGRLIQPDGIEHLDEGKALWSYGDPIEDMAFIVDGALEFHTPDGVRIASAGAVLGTWEVLSEGDRTETWVAREPTRLISIPRERFIDTLEDHFDFAYEYLRYCGASSVASWKLESEAAVLRRVSA